MFIESETVSVDALESMDVRVELGEAFYYKGKIYEIVDFTEDEVIIQETQ